MPKSENNNNGERNASDTEAQENKIQDNSFFPSETEELRTRVQPIPIQNLDLGYYNRKDRTGDENQTYGNFHVKIVLCCIQFLSSCFNVCRFHQALERSLDAKKVHYVSLLFISKQLQWRNKLQISVKFSVLPKRSSDHFR